MSSIFRRVIVKQLRAKDDNLADFRQWYYSLPINERSKFKEDMQALVEASEPFGRSGLTVKVEYEATWHAQDGGDSITVKARRSPKEILQAIDEWDRADEQNPSL